MTCAGIVDADLPTGTTVDGVQVIGNDNILDQLSPGLARVVLAVGVNRDAYTRQRLAADLMRRGLSPCTVIHPNAWIDPSAHVENGAQVFAGTIVNVGAHIAVHSVINTGALVEHDCYIAPLAFIGPRATLCGGVQIGRGALIGAGVTLLPGVSIPDNMTIPAGSVVRRSSNGRLMISRPLYTAMEPVSPEEPIGRPPSHGHCQTKHTQ